MAYLTTLASVPPERVDAFRLATARSLGATLSRSVSHLIAYGVEPQPLGKMLGEAIDGGEVLHPRFWHPLRPPLFHRPDRTREIWVRLIDEWERLEVAMPDLPDDDWYRIEILKVFDVFRHAAKRGEGVVSFLEKPMDFRSAIRVRLPRSG